LRLLGEIVADLYQRQVVTPLIQSALVNLEQQAIRREFVKHIGNEFDSVIAADIAGKNAKALKIDREMGSEYEKYGIAKGIATTVFLYSFSAGISKETTLPRIRIALLREGIPLTIVGDAITKLEEELWYFHSDKKQYAFKNQPNLNRVIVDREETVTEENIRSELKSRLQKNLGRAMDVYFWPENSSYIPDDKRLKLALLAPEFPCDVEHSKRLAAELFEKSGSGFRVYKNTLYVLAMDNAHYIALAKSLKRYLALGRIQNEMDFFTTLTKEGQEELRKKSKDAEKDIPFKLLTVYRHLVLLESNGIVWKDMGIPTIGMSDIISGRVKQYLQDQERILTRITPKYILDRTFAGHEQEKPLRDIYDLSLKTPGMPILENEQVLVKAIAEGVKQGFLGVKENEAVYYRQDHTPGLDALILRGEAAKTIKETEQQKEAIQSPIVEPSQLEEKSKEPGKVGGGIKTVTKVTLQAKIPWDKLSSVITGVIRPLKDQGQPPEIRIKIESEGEFDRTTLDAKVKETLHQIGAEIEEWKEE
jgi:hypothetical protein